MRSSVKRLSSLACVLLLAAVPSVPLAAQGRVTTPKQQFGFDIGADYELVNYTQLMAYWSKLARESNRMVLDTIGHSEEGRPMLMAIITSPENQKHLEHYRQISMKLALAKGLTDAQAHALAKEGKAVVWIDGGLHASEVLGAQQLIETVYEMVSRTDPETMRFLHDDIMLAVLANPDGMELVSNWYMRNPDPKKRSTGALPVLFQKYVGHDNNRDFYMANQSEARAINHALYHEWFPQIVYDHHQTGPAGTVIFTPPFRDPFNYDFDAIVPMELDLVGAAIHTRFTAHDMPGFTMRSGANYSTWWNGGLRTTPYFHNMIGLLTEAVGNPTPIQIPLVPSNELPHGDLPLPIAPQKDWHFKQSIAYELTANRAVLDVASRYREHLLYNIYEMGRNSIQKGSRDAWTVTPDDIDSLNAAVARDRTAADDGNGARSAGRRFRRGVPDKYFAMLHKPEDRDPRGYIIPADQPDFLTATKFVNTLVRGGVEVERATRAFTVQGKQYPAGSYVVKTAQAFRPHVLDMFEPQHYPNDFRYPGGPPIPPYDMTGWTLAYQMGVHFDRILDGFSGPFVPFDTLIAPPAGKVEGAGAGYLLSHATNDAFIAVNTLLAAHHPVYWLEQPVSANGQQYAAGTFYIPASGSVSSTLHTLASQLGLTFVGVPSKPAVSAFEMHPVRVALWDRYGGSIPSGWLRWLLEQYKFPYQLVYPQTLDAGNLKSKFDVIIMPDGAIPASSEGGGRSFRGQPDSSDIPSKYWNRLGNMTVAKTVPQLKQFLEDGGTILTVGTAGRLVEQLGLPLTNALVQRAPDGSVKPLSNEQFYVPGSVLQMAIDTTQPLAAGVGTAGRVDVMFDNDPVFRVPPSAQLAGVHTVGWFDSAEPLVSGWAWGQGYLDHGVAVAEVPVGKGRVVVLGPRIAFRAQSHGTFKFLFNGIYYRSGAGE